jgi:hypothetical protein
VNRYSDEFVLEQAKSCTNLAQLWRKLGWTDFQHVRAANDRLKLGLRSDKFKPGSHREPLPVPKPVGKGAKPKPKGGEE